MSPVHTTKPVVVKTSRGLVEYAATGEGPTVLALHGAMGGFDQSLLLARAAGPPGFRYLAVSRPGYLGTALSSGRTPEEQADLCAALLDELGIRSAAAIAVSGGGPCALQFASRHSRRCWALVMVSACSATLDGRVPFMFQVLKFVARWPAVIGFLSKRAESDPERAARRSIRDAAVRLRTVNDPEAGPMLAELRTSSFDRMRLRLEGTGNDIRQTRSDMNFHLNEITVPVLVIHGTDDLLVPYASNAVALAEQVRGAELLAIEGGEHVCLFTHLAEIRGRVSRFLGAHANRA